MSVLWQRLLDSKHTGEGLLYDILHEMVARGKSGFVPESAEILLRLLDETHEPQVWLLTCVLVGQMCNMTSVARNHLAQRGALSSLASVLNRSFSSLAYVGLSSEKGKLYEKLVKFLMTMLQYFSFGGPVCIHKMLQFDSFYAILSAVDCNTSALYAFGSTETKLKLDSLVAGRSVVGRRISTQSLSANDVYNRLLGCDVADLLGTELPARDSFIVDLYDTNSDDDVHIVEELMLSSSASSDWESLSDDLDDLNIDDGEWVDVHVTCVLDGAHFVAVFGAEHIREFHQLSESLDAAVANCFTSVTHLPSRGQLVWVSHPKLGGFRAYVMNAADSEKILTFAPDCGYVEEVPLVYLKSLDDCSITLPPWPPVHVCKLMG